MQLYSHVLSGYVTLECLYEILNFCGIILYVRMRVKAFHVTKPVIMHTEVLLACLVLEDFAKIACKQRSSGKFYGHVIARDLDVHLLKRAVIGHQVANVYPLSCE